MLSYGLGAASFIVLGMLLATVWRGRLLGFNLLLAVVVTGCWCALLAVFAQTGQPPFALTLIAEVGRHACWFLFLMRLLGLAGEHADGHAREFSLFRSAVGAACIAMVTWLLLVFLTAGAGMSSGAVTGVTHLGMVVLAVLGLMLVEQLYRNARSHHRWALKLLCFGLGGMFAYDLYMYSHALLLQALDPTLWSARGAVNALVVPLIAISAMRNRQWSQDIFISRHVAFHSAALLAAGGYLLLMAGAGYYIKLYGGTWGGVAQAVFLFGALVMLAMLMASGQARARLRVLLNKHFFRNKYEYRDEWLRFTDLLSHSNDDGTLRQGVVSGLASLVDAPCGALWERSASGRYAVVSSWHLDVPADSSLGPDSSLARFLARSGWVVQIDELSDEPERYEGLELPAFVDRLWKPWLIVPLLQGDRLEGFVVLSRSSTVARINWEDTDILKTVGRQAATHLAMMRIADALAEAQQFDAFNRLSSYVVHDLKNVAAQLSLVASNSKRHMNNPDFVSDAMLTVENATDKMNRMLGQLRKGRLEETTTSLVNLRPVLDKVIKARSADAPVPALRNQAGALIVSADADRLATVMEHIVQNAQEATPDDGVVEVVMRSEEGWACVDVTDTGCGMDEEFLTRRLFKPFETTKGNAGMGIGVYESREFVHMWGGEIHVQSAPGEGTVFTVRFPTDAQAQPDAQLEALN